MESSNAAIAPSLRRAREQRGWSRETLAHLSGVSWAAIAQLETGRRKDIRLSSLSALAAALEISLDQLATGRPGPAPSFIHSALVYRGTDEFLAIAVPFLRTGVAHRERPLAVTTPQRIRSLKAGLGRDASEVQFADANDWYRSPSAALAGYRSYLSDKQAAGAHTVRVLGEPVGVGQSASAVKAWTRYESLLNMVFATSSMVLTCPYDAQSARPFVIRAAHRTHPELAVADGSVVNQTYVRPEALLLEV